MNKDAEKVINLFMIDFEREVGNIKGKQMHFEDLQNVANHGAKYIYYLRAKERLDKELRVLDEYPFSENLDMYIEERFDEIMEKQ